MKLFSLKLCVYKCVIRVFFGFQIISTPTNHNWFLHNNKLFLNEPFLTVIHVPDFNGQILTDLTRLLKTGFAKDCDDSAYWYDNCIGSNICVWFFRATHQNYRCTVLDCKISLFFNSVVLMEPCFTSSWIARVHLHWAKAKAIWFFFSNHCCPSIWNDQQTEFPSNPSLKRLRFRIRLYRSLWM